MLLQDQPHAAHLPAALRARLAAEAAAVGAPAPAAAPTVPVPITIVCSGTLAAEEPYDSANYHLQPVRTARSYHGRPHFDFVEVRAPQRVPPRARSIMCPFRFARLEVLFKYYASADERRQGRGRQLALVQWLEEDSPPRNDVLKGHGAARFRWARVASLPSTARKGVLAAAVQRAAVRLAAAPTPQPEASTSGRRSERGALAGQRGEAMAAAAAEPIFTVIALSQIVRRVFMTQEFIFGERNLEERWRLNVFKWERPPADYNPLTAEPS
jgi:hypothetical protein